MQPLFTCDRCGERIGVYEPTVFVLGESARSGSEAALPEVAEAAEHRYHRDCYPPAALHPTLNQVA